MGIINIHDVIAWDDSEEISMSFLTTNNRG